MNQFNALNCFGKCLEFHWKSDAPNKAHVYTNVSRGVAAAVQHLCRLRSSSSLLYYFWNWQTTFSCETHDDINAHHHLLLSQFFKFSLHISQLLFSSFTRSHAHTCVHSFVCMFLYLWLYVYHICCVYFLFFFCFSSTLSIHFQCDTKNIYYMCVCVCCCANMRTIDTIIRDRLVRATSYILIAYIFWPFIPKFIHEWNHFLLLLPLCYFVNDWANASECVCVRAHIRTLARRKSN